MHANREIKLEVPQTGNVSVEWGTLEHPNRPATSLSVGPCNGGGKEWLVFAGGLWVVDTMSVPITVTSGEQRANAQVWMHHVHETYYERRPNIRCLGSADRLVNEGGALQYRRSLASILFLNGIIHVNSRLSPQLYHLLTS